MKTSTPKTNDSATSGNCLKPQLANRLLKFRAWDGKEMLKDIIPMNNYAITRVQGLENTTSYCYYVPVEKIMQYTELCDKNGFGIYEGDVCKCDFGNTYNKEKGFKFIKWDNIINGWGISADWANRFEVVGNIFENPELLQTTS